MRGKTQLKNATDELQANDVVVAGVSVEQMAIRCMIPEDSDGLKDVVDDVARNYMCKVALEATEDGTAVYQIIDDEEETMPWE